MFATRRRSLTKRILRQCHTTDVSDLTMTSLSDHNVDNEIKSAVQALVKRLKTRQLEVLVQTIEQRGTTSDGCVMVSKIPIKRGLTNLDPHVLACRLWRWSGLDDAGQLVCLPSCTSYDNQSESIVCCNPYHWNQLNQGTRDAIPDVDAESRHWQEPWCELVYREYRQHCGGTFPVFDAWTNVFQDLFHAKSGMCLSLVQSPTNNRCVERTRNKIGKGIVLERKDTPHGSSNVWLHNCSSCPVFICAPSDDVSCKVRRLAPGSSAKVYDSCEIDRLVASQSSKYDMDADDASGPKFFDSVHVSFGKGWSGNYSRQTITSCPSWMEILLRRQS